MLEEDTLDGREVVSGYVFQAPWTRELWPRMVVSEERQAVEYPDKSKRYPRLLWGTRGSPSTEYVHLVFPGSEPRSRHAQARAHPPGQRATESARAVCDPFGFEASPRLRAPPSSSGCARTHPW